MKTENHQPGSIEYANEEELAKFKNDQLESENNAARDKRFALADEIIKLLSGQSYSNAQRIISIVQQRLPQKSTVTA